MGERASQGIGGGAAVVRNQVLQIGKAAVDHVLGRDGVSLRRRRDIAPALIIRKEEGFVFPDWAAEGSAKEVLTVLRLRFVIDIVEVEIGVQHVVAPVFPGIAVKAVATGFDGGVDDCAGRVSKFGIEVTALQLKLLNGIGRRSDGRIASNRRAPVNFDVVVYAVQPKIVLP